MESSRGWEYWVEWQVIVCAAIVVLPTVVTVILLIEREKSHSRRQLNPSDLWIPCWANLNPIWLLFFRALSLAFMSFLLYHMVASYGPISFFFYTQWSFALVMVYFALATIVSARGCWMYINKPLPRNGERDELLKKDSQESRSKNSTTSGAKETKSDIKMQSRYNQDEIGQTTGFLDFATQTIYQASAGAAMLTDIVFWFLILPFLTDDNFQVDMLIGCMHSVNAILLILDSSLNSLQFPWYRLAYFLLWSVIYVVFQWVLHACGFTWWPYPFLDLSTPWAPLWYLGLALVHIPCYGFYVLLIKAKGSIFSKMFPRAFGRNFDSSRRNSQLGKKQA